MALEEAGPRRRKQNFFCIFLAGEKVYRLKKPVRFPYLNFSTLDRREAACRAELRLNRRVAPDVYLDVVPLTESNGSLSIDGAGAPVDWLVVMRRLDEGFTLDRMIKDKRIGLVRLDRLIATLGCFYRSATPICLPAAVHLADWWQRLAYNRRILLDPRFSTPVALVRRIDPP